MKIFVGCSSSDEIPEVYKEDCKKYLEQLLKDNDLVFGSYNKGIMSTAYKIALKNKRNITGICLKTHEKNSEELALNEREIVDKIDKRTRRLIEESNILIFLPGGTGTMQELFTAIGCKKEGEIDKPIIIYNSNNYFDDILKMLDKIYNSQYALD